MAREPRRDCPSLTRRGFVAGAVAAAGATGLGSLPGARSLAASPTAPGEIPVRRLGQTGARLPVVGVGCGSRFYRSLPDAEAARTLLVTAIENGVTFIETSANYGPDGISEQWVGEAMRTHRGQVFLETKVDARDHDGVMREVERSLERMQTDRLDLVLHHLLRTPEEVDEVLAPKGGDAALRRLVDEGVIAHVGFSAHLPSTALYGLERLNAEALQIPLNAVRYPDFESEVVPQANAMDVGLIAMKTCGNGFFHPAHATSPDRMEEYGPPEGAWDRFDIPTWREYIHYALSLPVTTATIGIDSFFTLDGVITAATTFEPLTAERMASISERAQDFRTTGYWIPRDRG